MHDVLNGPMVLIPKLFEPYMPSKINPFVKYAMLLIHYWIQFVLNQTMLLWTTTTTVSSSFLILHRIGLLKFSSNSINSFFRWKYVYRNDSIWEKLEDFFVWLKELISSYGKRMVAYSLYLKVYPVNWSKHEK